MSNVAAFPVLLPIMAGVLLLFLSGRTALQRALSTALSLGLLALSVFVTYAVWQNGIWVAQIGGWAAPYGIALAIDLLAGLMLILTGISLVTVLLYSPAHLEQPREKSYYYPVIWFLVAGMNLSFVTGDIFNLFVAFEVMLIASYFLVTLGGTKGQVREGFKYLVINATVSTLFLIAVAVLYGVTSSLNMADIARKTAEMPGNPVITLIGIVFLVVFGTKGALFPFYFWLPRAYFEAPTPVAAIFSAVMTKVGVYALMRIFTLIFIHDTAFTHTLLLVMAGCGMLLGVMGAISQYDFKAILAYHSISQIGYMVMGLALLSRNGLAGTIFFLAHHSVVKSALFLVAGTVERLTGYTSLKKYSGLLTSHPGLAYSFLALGLSLAGIPPFSGFFAKFVLLRGGAEQGQWIITAVAILTGVFTLFSMVKIYRKGFWAEESGQRIDLAPGQYGRLVAPALLLLALSVAMGLGARPMYHFAVAAADQLLSPAGYIHAVLGR